MLTKSALSEIRSQLPKDGYQLISERSGVSKESVKKILSDPKRFNKIVLDAAITLIEDEKKEILILEARAKALISTTND